MVRSLLLLDLIKPAADATEEERVAFDRQLREIAMYEVIGRFITSWAAADGQIVESIYRLQKYLSYMKKEYLAPPVPIFTAPQALSSRITFLIRICSELGASVSIKNDLSNSLKVIRRGKKLREDLVHRPSSIGYPPSTPLNTIIVNGYTRRPVFVGIKMNDMDEKWRDQTIREPYSVYVTFESVEKYALELDEARMNIAGITSRFHLNGFM